MTTKRSRRWIWFLALGICLTLFGLYDALFLAFIREGCITGVASACRQAPIVAIRAHSCVFGGFTIVIASVIMAIRRRSA